MAALTAGTMLLVWLATKAAGYWNSTIPAEALRLLHEGIESLRH